MLQKVNETFIYIYTRDIDLLYEKLNKGPGEISQIKMFNLTHKKQVILHDLKTYYIGQKLYNMYFYVKSSFSMTFFRAEEPGNFLGS